MQYLLDEAEMAAIRAERIAIAEKLPGRSVANHLEGLANVCRYVATMMTETGSNLANGRKPSTEPHGCIHDPHEARRARYCDDCAVAGICPLPKEYSK